MAATYHPLVRRTCGGDELEVASGGKIDLHSGSRLDYDGTAFITSGGSLASPGNLTLTSGLNATTGTFSSSVTVAANLTVTSGVNAATGQFGGNVTGSSGCNFTTGAFSGGISLTSGISIGALAALSSAFTIPVQTVSSDAAVVWNYGLSMVASTGDSEHIMSMAAPTAGRLKIIVCDNVLKSSGVSTGAAIITSSGAGAGYGAYTSILFTTGSANHQYIILLGENTTNWAVISKSTDCTLSAT